MNAGEGKCCCFTGYRPYRFAFSPEGLRPEQVQAALAEQVERLYAEGYRRFFTGMCLGVDLWGAEAVLRARARHPEIALEAVIPFEGQESRWTVTEQQEYRRVRAACQGERVLFSPTEMARDAAACYRARNRWMVEHSEAILAVFSFDGADVRSGTAATVRYARRLLKRVVYIHPRTLAVSEETVQQLELPRG